MCVWGLSVAIWAQGANLAITLEWFLKLRDSRCCLLLGSNWIGVLADRKATRGPMVDDLVNKTCVRFVLCLCHGVVLWDIWTRRDSWHWRLAAMMSSSGPRLEVDACVAARLADLRIRFTCVYLDVVRPSTLVMIACMLIRAEFVFINPGQRVFPLIFHGFFPLC